MGVGMGVGVGVGVGVEGQKGWVVEAQGYFWLTGTENRRWRRSSTEDFMNRDNGCFAVRD